MVRDRGEVLCQFLSFQNDFKVKKVKRLKNKGLVHVVTFLIAIILKLRLKIVFHAYSSQYPA